MLGSVPIHQRPTLWDIKFFPAIAAQRSIFKATFVKLGFFFQGQDLERKGGGRV